MKIWNYIFITVTLLMVMQFFGFPTGLQGIFNFLGVGFNTDNSLNTVSVSGSGLDNYFFLGTGGFLAAIAATGVGIGLFALGKGDIAIKASIATAIFTTFAVNIIFPLKYALELGISAWVISILAVLFIPLTIGFFIALIYFVVGGTTD